MAKDGTNRGGARPGAGRKPKALKDKITEGKLTPTVLTFPDVASFSGEDVPPPKEYLKSAQKNGKGMCAEEIYNETWAWLRERSCDKLVNQQLVEQYAMSVARWIQCEECVSEFGFLAKHPTTGNAIQSPYVAMAQSFMKQANHAWYQIYQIVKENCASDYSGVSPQDDAMERLLKARRGG